MYIILDCTGWVCKTAEITTSMIEDCKNNEISIIRVSDMKQMNLDGEWVDIDEIEEN
jgi:hypothetical protein